jgi:hypothetical protein
MLAGKQPQALSAQTTIPASSFESATVLPAKWAYVAAQALNASGRVLGTSATVPVGSYASSFATARSSR